MQKQQTVRIEIPVGTKIARNSDGASLKAAKVMRVMATPHTWRGMTTGYTFTIGDVSYSINTFGTDVRRVDED